MVLAGPTPPEWEIAIVDENLSTPNYEAMPRPDLVGITAFMPLQDAPNVSRQTLKKVSRDCFTINRMA